jgi:YD repeat-containing protein
VFDRRLSKSVDATPTDGIDAFFTRYAYDREDVLFDFTDPDGAGPTPQTLARRYLHGPAIDQVLAQEDAAGNVAWLLPDHLGTTRDLVDEAGHVLNHVQYDSFGNVVSESDPANSTRYLFTGREFDPETGLYFYRRGITTQGRGGL